MNTYNHAFTLAFAVAGSTREDGEDITPTQMAEAIRAHVAELLAGGELLAATGAPFDTFCEGAAQ